ncbi:hypothetical protein, partial [Klebsiella pneumoniae]|uniref:hypothetical protein n=1 Tax=Klebsiella pneumoniae TaxID=573 RepID=UPI003F7A5DF3
VGHLFMFLVGGKTPDQSVHLNLTTTDLRKSFQGRAGSTNVAGLLQNEPGALFIQCSLFLFLLRICYPAPGF